MTLTVEPSTGNSEASGKYLLRELAAILFADVAGYTKLTNANSPVSAYLMGEIRVGFDKITAPARTRQREVFGWSGDCYKCSFAACDDALAAAMQMHLFFRDFVGNLRTAHPDLEVSLRIGLHCGPVQFGLDNKAMDFFGPTVNAAARFERLAPEGGIAISKAFRDAITQQEPLFEFAGTHILKGFDDVFEVWILPGESIRQTTGTRVVISGEYAELPACEHCDGQILRTRDSPNYCPRCGRIYLAQHKNFLKVEFGIKLGDCIGMGGMGAVYAGEFVDGEHVGRRCALKFMSPKLLLDHADAAKRFEEEFTTLRVLGETSNSSPKVYTSGVIRGTETRFLVMEFVDGISIRNLLDSHRKAGTVIDWRYAVGIGKEICLALNDAHTHGVIHRDVKPSNIILINPSATSLRIKLVDFGISLRVSNSVGRERGYTAVGTLGYSAPEQISGHGCDHRADIYSLGMVLYEMLVGSLPYSGRQLVGIAGQPAEAVTSPFREPFWKSDTGLRLREVVEMATAADPMKRFQTALQFADNLSSILSSSEKHPIPRLQDAIERREALGLSVGADGQTRTVRIHYAGNASTLVVANEIQEIGQPLSFVLRDHVVQMEVASPWHIADHLGREHRAIRLASFPSGHFSLVRRSGGVAQHFFAALAKRRPNGETFAEWPGMRPKRVLLAKTSFAVTFQADSSQDLHLIIWDSHGKTERHND